MTNFRYILLEWNYTEWILADYPCNNENHEERKEWLSQNQSTLPIPKRQLQDIITFKWYNFTMTGDIRQIHLPIDNGIPQELRYTAYATGHGRYVCESNILGI